MMISFSFEKNLHWNIWKEFVMNKKSFRDGKRSSTVNLVCRTVSMNSKKLCNIFDFNSASGHFLNKSYRSSVRHIRPPFYAFACLCSYITCVCVLCQ
nr:MAG TPA: hypothetical protein [Caudoviricetes sp.]